MTVHYTVRMDRADDGTFSEDCGADLLVLRWRQGMDAPFDSLTAPTWARLTLHNPGNRYDAALIGKSLRIVSDDDSITVTHFTGQIAAVTLSADDLTQPQAIITAQGMDAVWFGQRVTPPLLADVRSDEALLALLRSLDWRYPAQAGRLIVNRGTVGDTLFDRDPMAFLLQSGRSSFTDFSFAGEDDGATQRVYAADWLREIVRAEGGRCYTDHEGRIVFLNRHHLLLDETIAAHFDDDLLAVETTSGADDINAVQIRIQPRAVGTPAVLWALGQPVKIESGARLVLRLSYQHEGQPCAAHSISHLTAQVNSRADGAGSDLSGAVTVVLIEIGGRSATLEIRSNATTSAYLIACQLYGQPLLEDDPVTVVRRDDARIVDHGLRLLALDLPLLETIADAAAFADWELLRRRDVVGGVRVLHVDARHHPDAVRLVALFDRVRVTLSRTAHTADYVVIAAEHHMDRGGTRHRASWLLEPAPDAVFFVIDRHNTDSGRILAPR